MKNKKKDFIWNTLGVTFNAFTSLFFLVIVNRINGIEHAGIFSYAFSIACLFYVMALYYNRTYQVADVKNRYDQNQYITNRLISSILTILVIIIFTIINQFDIYKSSIIILLMLYKIFEAISDCYHAFIQKKDELYYVGESLFYKAIFGVSLFIIIDIITKNIIYSIIGLNIVNALGLIIDIKKYERLYQIKFRIKLDNTSKLYKEAFPLFLFSFLTIYLCNSQKYILEYLMEESFQTVLGIIIMPATMLSLCGQYLITPYLNDLSISYSKSKIKDIEKIINRVIGAFLGLGVIILAVAFFLGIPVLNIIYGVDINSYKTAFLIIILGAVFYALSTIISNCLTILNRNKEQLLIFIISSLLSTLFSYIFIKSYNINGASYAYFVTMILHFIMIYVLFRISLKVCKKVTK